jgi:hypothetical protein
MMMGVVASGATSGSAPAIHTGQHQIEHQQMVRSLAQRANPLRMHDCQKPSFVIERECAMSGSSSITSTRRGSCIALCLLASKLVMSAPRTALRQVKNF